VAIAVHEGPRQNTRGRAGLVVEAAPGRSPDKLERRPYGPLLHALGAHVATARLSPDAEWVAIASSCWLPITRPGGWAWARTGIKQAQIPFGRH
jgi:hypothetical protein